jgi:hypothetical protein
MMTAAETWESPSSTGEGSTSDVDGAAEAAWMVGGRLWSIGRAPAGHSVHTTGSVEKPRKLIETLARSC